MNSCLRFIEEFGSSSVALAYYSHIVPLIIAILLGGYVLYKARFSYTSKLFVWFVFFFSLWLIGDLVTWVSGNYSLITFFWSQLDYINVLFFSFAAYFFVVVSKERDVSIWHKLFLGGLTLPAFFVTYQLGTAQYFEEAWCNVSNSSFLTNYKLIQEFVCIAYIAGFGFVEFWENRKDRVKRNKIVVLGSAFILFLGVFAVTEYVASIFEGIYHINLYGLFVLPLFLGMIIFSITNLKLFVYRSFGMQLLIYVLLIMVGSQFFFLQNATYRILTVATFVLSLFIGTLLVRNIRREEELAIALEVANEGQADLLHILNHQIKGYLTKARITFDAVLTDKDYGPVSSPAQDILKRAYIDITEGVNFVQDFLNASNIDRGTFTYTMASLDFKEVVEKVLESQRETAQQKGLGYEINIGPGEYKLNGDKGELGQAVKNLIDNSIKYTPAGSLNIKLERKDDKILFTVKDTGVGLSDEVKPKLFTKGGRDKDSIRINVNSTGFGLAFVKGVATAHKGRVWAESPGHGKGSTFYLELPVNS